MKRMKEQRNMHCCAVRLRRSAVVFVGLSVVLLFDIARINNFVVVVDASDDVIVVVDDDGVRTTTTMEPLAGAESILIMEDQVDAQSTDSNTIHAETTTNGGEHAFFPHHRHHPHTTTTIPAASIYDRVPASSSSSSKKSSSRVIKPSHVLASEFRTHHATIAGGKRGGGKPLHTSLLVSKYDLLTIGKSILETVLLADIILLIAVGWGTVPLVELFYEQMLPILATLIRWPFAPNEPIQHSTTTTFESEEQQQRHQGPSSSTVLLSKPQQSSPTLANSKQKYRDTIYFHIADHIQQATRIALAVYGVDILKLVGFGLGLFGTTSSSDTTTANTILGGGGGGSTVPPFMDTQNLHHNLPFSNPKIVNKIPHAFGQAAYTVWASRRLAALKRYMFRQYVSRHPETFGRIKLINRLCDAMLYATTVAIIANILQVQMGVAVQSVLAVGSVGTLAIGLASQGIAKEVLNGLVLASSDRIYEGDDVLFGTTGLTGRIVKLGWMETVVRGSDEITVSIPNTDLVRERVSNLSRVRLSQVKQVLRLRYDDADKIPMLIDRIKYEIKMSCPEVITDGSRPFRVHWTSMNADHCELTIDTRHRIKPTGDIYYDNRQNVLIAIHRALKRHNCKLVESPVVTMR